MADSETQQPVETSQQVTSKTSTTKQKHPKNVAAGKALQKNNREAREAQKQFMEEQKKALDEANMKIAEYELEKSETRVTDTPVESTKNVLTTTKWLSVISIFVSLVGIYYKREEIKSFSAKKPTVNTVPLAPTLAPKRKVGISSMD